MAELRGREGVPSRALEFVVLTGVRTNEALGAEWSEFDLDAAVWKIPGPRMKMRKPQKEDIERQLGYPLNWEELPEGKQSRIAIYLNDADPTDKVDWPRQHDGWPRKLTSCTGCLSPASPPPRRMPDPDFKSETFDVRVEPTCDIDANLIR